MGNDAVLVDGLSMLDAVRASEAGDAGNSEGADRVLGDDLMAGEGEDRGGSDGGEGSHEGGRGEAHDAKGGGEGGWDTGSGRMWVWGVL